MKKLFAIAIIILFIPTVTTAATLYFLPEEVSVPPHEPFAVTVMLDSEQQSVNAVSGELHFPSDQLILREIRDGDSIINFWLEHPATNSPGVVSFAGVIPGGFSGILSPFHTGGEPGKLFTLIFSATKEGTATVSWSQVSAYLNSADSQSAEVITKPLTISSKVGVANSAPVVALATDIDPPELFQPTISHDPNLFDGRWFIAFTTRDTGSGLDHYEMAEHRQPEPASSDDWQKATSPFLLRDQNLGSYVSVRALDRAGNERVVTLSPAVPALPYAKYYLWVIIILLCCGAFFYYFYYYRRRF